MKRVNALLSRSVPSAIKNDPNHSPTAETRSFVHKPLDETRSSLRLVTISSELSTDGIIQCYVSHSVLERASYVCLSYRWGDPGDTVRININGAPFFVRRNVYDFLDMMRRMPMTFYWIDVICIDQTNISERSQQVGQMGRIFSGAFLVYLWLNKMPLMTPWMQYLRNEKTQQAYNTLAWAVILEAQQTVNSCVFNNEYWSRAWALQEIALARSIVVLMCRESFKFPELVKTVHKFNNVDLGSFRECAMAQFADFVNDRRPQSLIHLLDKFRDHGCEIPRDRIYSLLSLSADAQLPRVDYTQPSEDVAYEVLRRSDEPLCVCSALLVGQLLGLSAEQRKSENVHTRGHSATLIEFNVKGIRFARHCMLANDEIQSWAHYKLMGTNMFGHDYVFSGFCPAFDAVMDGLQSRAMHLDITDTSKLEDTAPVRPSTPLILKTMDKKHRLALQSGFGPAVTIYAPNASTDVSTVQVALELMVDLVPQSIKLCSRLAHRKEPAKPRKSEELLSTHDREAILNQVGPTQRRPSEWSPKNYDFHRVDSANPSKGQEEEGPISRLRVWRTQLTS